MEMVVVGRNYHPAHGSVRREAPKVSGFSAPLTLFTMPEAGVSRLSKKVSKQFENFKHKGCLSEFIGGR